MKVELFLDHENTIDSINECIAAYEAMIRDLINERNKIIFEQGKEKDHE